MLGSEPWKVDAGDVELADGDVDGVQVGPGVVGDWSGVWDLSGVPLLYKQLFRGSIVKLLLPCEFSEHKYIPHLRMESIWPLRNRWGWRHLGLRAMRGCCCVLEEADGKELILTTLHVTWRSRVRGVLDSLETDFLLIFTSQPVAVSRNLISCLPSVFACANRPLQVPFTSVWGIRNQQKRKSRDIRALF